MSNLGRKLDQVAERVIASLTVAMVVVLIVGVVLTGEPNFR
jgi:TRAP-type C4-dicarboxylate transport system permease small subunit